MTSPAAPRVRRRRRPFALVALAGIMLFKALLLGLFILGAFLSTDSEVLRMLRMEGVQAAIAETYVALAFAVLVTVLLFASALGLLAYRRAGWLVAMVTTGVFVMFDIIGFFSGNGNFIWMVLNIITVFYLNQREVREGVGVAEPQAPAPGAAIVR